MHIVGIDTIVFIELLPCIMKKLQYRYGDEIPADELVISPTSMYVSDKLITVYKN